MRILAAATVLAVSVAIANGQGASEGDRRVFRIGGDVSDPRVLSNNEPSYSEEARLAGAETTVILSIVIGPDGHPQNINVVKPSGFGLDEKAVEAVRDWRFEPSRKDGRPVAVSANVEVNFRLGKKVPGQKDLKEKLNFSLAPGVERPELIKGKIPPAPQTEGDERLRVQFSLNTLGYPEKVKVLETTNPAWASKVMLQIANWRFNPAVAAGKTVEADGVFEMTVGNPGPVGRPLEKMVRIPNSQVEDTSLTAPNLLAPLDQATFDDPSRRTVYQWEATPNAAGYLLEWDYSSNGVWHSEELKIPGFAFSVPNTQYSFEFIGAQPGRWRVWPVNVAGKRGNPSEWRTFRFTR